MAHSAQAGARRVVAALAAGLGIAITIMAFAPATPTSSPEPALVGIHEANYEVEEEAVSPLKYYFKVHTALMLRPPSHYYEIRQYLDGQDYEGLAAFIRDYYWHRIHDPRARGILAQIGVPPQHGDSASLHLLLNQDCGVAGRLSCFHVFMRYELNQDEADSIISYLGTTPVNWRAIRDVIRDKAVGNRPQGICEQVRDAADPTPDSC